MSACEQEKLHWSHLKAFLQSVFSCGLKKSCTGQEHHTWEDIIKGLLLFHPTLPGFHVEYRCWRRALTSTLVVGEVEVDQEVGAGEMAGVANYY